MNMTDGMREFDLLAEAVRHNLPNSREVFESLVRPLVRKIIERKLRQQLHRSGETLPDTEFAELVEVGAKHLYDSLLASILRTPGAETVVGSWPSDRRSPKI